MALTAALAVIAPAPAASAGPGDATAAKRRSCGTIASSSIYSRARVVAIRHVRCPKARRIARRYDNAGRQTRNWRCGLARDSPRLFSCGSGGRRGDLRKFPRALEAVGVGRPSSAAARARATGRLKRCGNGRGSLVNNIRDIRARNTSCREARRVVGNLRCAGPRCKAYRSRGKAGRYRCTIRQLGVEQSRQRCHGEGGRRVGWIGQA